MVRTFAVAVSVRVAAAAIVMASASWAAEVQSNSGARSQSGGGGPIATVVTPVAKPEVAGNEAFVTGEVVMTTPSEIVIHTDKGMERFTVGPEMANAYVPVEGDTVTLGYVPAAGTVRRTTIKPAPTASTPVVPSVTEPTAPAGGEPTMAPATAPAQQAGPVSSPQPSGAGANAAPRPPESHPRAERLPKTASDRPLILLLGVAALMAAGALRIAARA